MRRTLAAATIAAAAFLPATTATAAPDCDITQNCVCVLVNYAYDKVTGEPLFTCA